MKRYPICALLIALTGCAGSQSDPALDATLKTFQTAPKKAGIYVYRNETVDAGLKMNVMVDGKSIGKTVGKTYLYHEVKPGKHTITAEAENTDTLEVDLQPGTITYIWQDVKISAPYAKNKLHIMDEDEGQKGVMETKLIVGR
ncbi:DUF2846 domain-containing protein [Azomonas macrocytogenes]|uniref:DUF2846 domain-containing protein n=1 Tax=Azomonas macrocytogenes TaxID=69962 RepID=A0A839T9P9_AZOMA|nr:DUF2846 domain-containing protein [Azomonas macrocytogenes]MBB3104914.1 hypothetical protein [Azomonas macrocytogenes]